MSSFPISQFWPLAIGFLSLSINYFVQGGTTLTKYPNWSKDKASFDRTIGLWGIFMGGFGQLITGTYLMVGLSWFPVYRNAAPLYMAALAFSVYGLHWIVLGYRRYIGAEYGPEGWMAIPVLGLGILGAFSFGGNGDIPAMILFIGLSLIYVSEIFWRLGNSKFFEKATGFFQLLTGIWLFYLTVAVTMNFANGMHFWV